MFADLPTPGYGTLIALMLFIAASVWLGTLAQRMVHRGSFLTGYFLGSRTLGSWAVALTATVQSGGTFMGFPSMVYSHGWSVAMFISSYMVVPMAAFGILGKRLAQISRRTGAITIPDFFRERFNRPAVGLTASLLILLFLSAMMVAQFKAGASIMKIAWPGSGELAFSEDAKIDTLYLIGLAVFTITVVGYTLIGGFLAAVWTDLLQSVVMLIGVVALLILALYAAGGLENATRGAVAATNDSYAFGPGYAKDGRAFMTVGLAVSFFFNWFFAGLGNPAGLVRVMACKDTPTLRRSIFMLSVYNALIYVPLIIICICARAVMPEVAKSDEVIPRMALWTTRDLPGGSLLAGLILAAPFGAVMATVSCYLVVIASGLVRDVYQRFIRPNADERTLRRLTRGTMVVVGIIAVAANINPVDYLQALVIFSGTGAATAFVIPALMAAYWRRATGPGAIAAMLIGAGTLLVLYVIGWLGDDPMIGAKTAFRPYFLLGVDPLIWGLLASLVAGVVGSLLSAPPDQKRVALLFDAQPPQSS